MKNSVSPLVIIAALVLTSTALAVWSGERVKSETKAMVAKVESTQSQQLFEEEVRRQVDERWAKQPWFVADDRLAFLAKYGPPKYHVPEVEALHWKHIPHARIDWDGDCFCADLIGCRASVNPACQDVRPGDCDDNAFNHDYRHGCDGGPCMWDEYNDGFFGCLTGGAKVDIVYHRSACTGDVLFRTDRSAHVYPGRKVTDEWVKDENCDGVIARPYADVPAYYFDGEDPDKRCTAFNGRGTYCE